MQISFCLITILPLVARYLSCLKLLSDLVYSKQNEKMQPSRNYLNHFYFLAEFNKTVEENEVSFSFFIKRQRVKDVISAIGFVFGFYCSLI